LACTAPAAALCVVFMKRSRQSGCPIKKIERNKSGQLLVYTETQPEPFEDVCVARCFPWSEADGYVSIYRREGGEIALLETLDELDAESRRAVEEELEMMIFTPRIERVVSHRREFGVTSITAETDRGEVTFQIRSRDDVRSLSPTRALFRDADGNTYEVPDLDALDAQSRRFMMQYF